MNRDVSQQQWQAYMYWLEDRGLTAPLPRRRVLEHPETTTVALTPPTDREQAAQALLPADSVHVVVETFTPSVKVLIITQNLDNDAARSMVDKIALALGLQAADYRLVSDAKALPDDLRSAQHLLVFGREGAQLAAEAGIKECALYELRAFGEQGKILLLPHPLVMLAQPQLKIRAWEGLQRLKAYLEV